MGCQLQQNTSERIKLENIYIHILREQYQQTFPKQKSTDYLRLVCMTGTSAECWTQELISLLLEVPRLPATYRPFNLSLKTSHWFWNNALITVSFLRKVNLINCLMYIPIQERAKKSPILAFCFNSYQQQGVRYGQTLHHPWNQLLHSPGTWFNFPCQKMDNTLARTSCSSVVLQNFCTFTPWIPSTTPAVKAIRTKNKSEIFA